MNNIATEAGLLFDKAADYSRTSVELLKLKAIDKSAELVSTLITKIVLIAIVAMFILSISIGLSIWIGELVGKVYLGFFIMAGFYAFLSLLVYFFKDQWIKIPVSNSFISQLN